MGNAAARIVVVGAGGLGASACWGLWVDWPTTRPLELHIYDPDSVELSNLNRQVLFHECDTGKPKAECLSQRLAELSDSPCVTCTPFQQKIDDRSIDSALQGAELVIDACDSTSTKFLLNDYCVSQGIPLIYGGAVGENGQLMLIAARPGTPCLRCLFGELTEQEVESQTNSCRRDGIFGSVVGQVGFLQAQQAISALCQELTAGTLIRTTLDEPKTKVSQVQAELSCPLGCGKPPDQKLDIRDKHCPDTFLYTKLALEQLNAGETLDLRLGSEESLSNVIQSAAEEGFRLAAPAREIAMGHWRVMLGRS